MKSLAPLIVFTVCLIVIPLRGDPQKAPNFIVILSDDQGWTHTSVLMDRNDSGSRSDFFQTPNLQRLAAMGRRFSRGYAPSCVCSPTRYSILFGKTAARIGHTKVRANLQNIDYSQPTLPQLLKDVNPDYATAHFGKWHIEADPTDLGYEESDGRTSNNDGHYHLKTNNKWGGIPHEDPKQIFQLTDRAMGFISRQVTQGHPFFVQISHYANHGWIMAKEETAEKYRKLPKGKLHKHPYYAAMNENLDTGVGMILDHLESLGIADHTYIFYLSDNGGLPQMPPYGYNAYEISQNYPLTRGKWALLEGGIRVPFLVSGPGIEPNSQSDVPVVGYDLLPTVLELAGRPESLPESFDGGSLAPVLFGNGPVRRGTAPLIFHYPHYNKWGINEPHSAIIDGDYKLVKLGVSGRAFLYNVAKDPGEKVDIRAEHPELAQSLETYLENYLRKVGAETKEMSPTWEANKTVTSSLF